MEIGHAITDDKAKAQYELLKENMTDIVILKKTETEIIKRFNYKSEVYSVIYDLNKKTNKFELINLLRLYND